MADVRHFASDELQKYLRNKYRSIQWKSRVNFYKWYEQRFRKQKGLCEYCHLPGNTMCYYHKQFRPDKNDKCKRGLHLEIDRRESKKEYSPSNCVLACYPCNNAKSDVFSYDEFREIGKAIGKVKKRESH